MSTPGCGGHDSAALAVGAATTVVAAATAVALVPDGGRVRRAAPAVADGDTVSPASDVPTTVGDLKTVGYTITRASDGSITLTVAEVFDAPKLIARLKDFGVTAVPMTKNCLAPDGKLSTKAARQAWRSVDDEPVEGRQVTSMKVLRLLLKRVPSGHTLIVGTWSSGIPGGEGKAATEVAGLRLNPGAKTPTCLPGGF